jgi:hypothetical protein
VNTTQLESTDITSLTTAKEAPSNNSRREFWLSI